MKTIHERRRSDVLKGKDSGLSKDKIDMNNILIVQLSDVAYRSIAALTGVSKMMQLGTVCHSIALWFQTAGNTEAFDPLQAVGPFHPPFRYWLGQRLIPSVASLVELL